MIINYILTVDELLFKLVALGVCLCEYWRNCCAVSL